MTAPASPDAPVAVVSTRRFAWIDWAVRQEAARRRRAIEPLVVDSPEGAERFARGVASGAFSGAIFVTIHPIVALGGPGALVRLANDGIPLVVWNVDHPALVWRTLPRACPGIGIGIVHVSESDAAFWSAVGDAEQACSFTNGIGPHGQVHEHRAPPPPIAERPIGVLVPMNLRWCARTLEEIERDVRCLPAVARRVFEGASAATRPDPSALPLTAVREALRAEGVNAPDAAVRQLVRLVVYDAHLWRRERIVDALLDLPVTIDSNDLPERLLRGRTPRATLLRESDPRRTVDRTTQARAVVSTSFSPDLLHDRPLNAALLGAASIVERNRAFSRWLEDGRSAFFFGYGANDVAAAAERALGDAACVQAIADEAGQIVAGGKIDYRFGTIFDVLELVSEPALR